MIGNTEHGRSFLDKSRAFQAKLKHDYQPASLSGKDIAAATRGPCDPALLQDSVATLNETGGWAAASDAMETARRLVAEAGVTFKAGDAVKLIVEDGDVRGVQTSDGVEHRADLVVLAAGSWTAALLPSVAENALATGQVLALMQLTGEEASKCRDMRVCLSVDNGL